MNFTQNAITIYSYYYQTKQSYAYSMTIVTECNSDFTCTHLRSAQVDSENSSRHAACTHAIWRTIDISSLFGSPTWPWSGLVRARRIDRHCSFFLFMRITVSACLKNERPPVFATTKFVQGSCVNPSHWIRLGKAFNGTREYGITGRAYVN